jgi:DNA-binding CsgD family transcriptional regulator
MNADRLNETDLLALLKLANRLHELPANPVVRHEFMLTQLCGLSEATVGFSALLDAPPHEAAQVVFLVYHGMENNHQHTAINRYLRALDAPMSAPTSLIRLLESRVWETASRCTNGDGTIDQSLTDTQELCKPLNLGAAIFSSIPLRGTRMMSVLSVHRNANDNKPFTPRQRRLVQLFHSEIGWTFQQQFPTEPGSGNRLTPRQQQTLRHLLIGDNEKQIAQKLARSHHTVHTYVKAIYKNFRVSSRGELLSLFVK